MSLSVNMRTFRTSDLTDLTAAQRFSPVNDVVLRAVKAWLVFFNNPTFTTLRLDLYSDAAGSPASLLQSSTARSKASFNVGSTANLIEASFNFPYPSLKGGDHYHLVLTASGYTEGANSFIGWKHDFPDPVYSSAPASMVSLGVSPLAFSLIDSEAVT